MLAVVMAVMFGCEAGHGTGTGEMGQDAAPAEDAESLLRKGTPITECDCEGYVQGSLLEAPECESGWAFVARCESDDAPCDEPTQDVCW